MLTWITTVGWSPFAVINPIWAYCKEKEETPDKVIFLYTSRPKVVKNLKLCKKHLFEVLIEYSNKIFNEENFISYEIRDEKYETYGLMLDKIIKNELHEPETRIILDMTPGRKYMPAINMFLGLKSKKNEVRVLYLYLEEEKYQNTPYPLTPKIKSELIDIIESAERILPQKETLKLVSENREEDQ